MKYSFKDVVSSYPKNHIESFWTKITVRPISFPIAWILVNIGCTAWLASVISIVVAILACVCFFIPFMWARILGICLIVFWQILDCVDGTIARTTKKTSTMGEFIDAQSGYTIMGFVFLSVALSGFYTSWIIAEEFKYLIIAIGGISSVSNVLARLINSKYLCCSYTKEYKTNGTISLVDPNEKPSSLFGKIRVFVDFNIGLVGIFVPLLIVAEVFKVYDIVTFIYCAYSVLGFLSASAIYALKSK